MDNLTLLPCPFCQDGGMPRFHKSSGVKCHKCGAWGPAWEKPDGAAWNTRATPQSEWQDIATAPKDCPVILLRPDRNGSGSRVCVGRYDDDKYARRPRPFWKSYFGGLGVQYDRGNPPTRWQPMPGDANG